MVYRSQDGCRTYLSLIDVQFIGLFKVTTVQLSILNYCILPIWYNTPHNASKSVLNNFTSNNKLRKERNLSKLIHNLKLLKRNNIE